MLPGRPEENQCAWAIWVVVESMVFESLHACKRLPCIKNGYNNLFFTAEELNDKQTHTKTATTETRKKKRC